MSTYEILRHFADSWMLLAFTLFFFAVVMFVFRAGSAAQYDKASRIPLDDDEDKV
jgi:cytochrome c oxidase cbb3-type subunit IV